MSSSQQFPPMRLPQLHMYRPDLENLPPVELPDGYELRTYRPGDEAIWGKIMDVCLPLERGGRWLTNTVREFLTDQPQFDPDGLYFATWHGMPVGTATAWLRRPEEREIGYVHMVGVLPDHRGRRLGYVVSLATLHRFRERSLRAAMLDTDDFRLSAIRAYLDLGFEPEQRHPSHPERWAVILAALNERAPLAYPSAAPAIAGPIGLVHNDVKAPIHEGWSEIVSEIELFPAFEEALEGIEGFSHLQILFWIHRVTVEQRLIRRLHPRDRAELPLMGVLATRSQYRPNPIGSTVVRLLGRQGRRLRIQGLDAIDGTPILDIKPVSRREVAEDEVRVPEWMKGRT